MIRNAVTILLVLTFAACAPIARPISAPTVHAVLDPPVIEADFPDPFLLRTPTRFLAFATASAGLHVQVAGSPDLLHWSLLTTAAGRSDALPVLPAWVRVNQPDVWAPEVLKVGATYNLYFSARHRSERHERDEKECVGVATSTAPEGPYRPQDEPLVCTGLPSGVIDPSPFRDGSRLYLYYKRDGNCCGHGSGVLVQDLSPDGLRVTGGRTETGVRNDQPWEGQIVEAPTMLKRRGRYLMFYSAADYAGAAYAVGYARCRTPTGPCVDAEENPILKSRQLEAPRLIGPGHQALLQWGGRTFMAYHAWQVLPDGRRGPARFMHVSEVIWRGDKPDVESLHRPLPAAKWRPDPNKAHAEAAAGDRLPRR